MIGLAGHWQYTGQAHRRCSKTGRGAHDPRAQSSSSTSTGRWSGPSTGVPRARMHPTSGRSPDA